MLRRHLEGASASTGVTSQIALGDDYTHSHSGGGDEDGDPVVAMAAFPIVWECWGCDGRVVSVLLHTASFPPPPLGPSLTLHTL